MYIRNQYSFNNLNFDFFDAAFEQNFWMELDPNQEFPWDAVNIFWFGA